MKQLLSVWLVPQLEDEKYLSDVVNKLAKKNNSPVFIPHLTLFGDIKIEIGKLKNAIDKVSENIKPIKIKKTQISQSEIFFKTVFIEFEKNEILTNIFENFVKETNKKKDINTFKPHVSLMYKLLTTEDKLKIIENINIKDEYIMDRIFINAPKEETEDFYNVKGWRSLYIKQLS